MVLLAGVTTRAAWRLERADAGDSGLAIGAAIGWRGDWAPVDAAQPLAPDQGTKPDGLSPSRKRTFFAHGDGVIAYFGHPQAHDHDAERAARAGLAILDAINALNGGDDRPKL